MLNPPPLNCAPFELLALAAAEHALYLSSPNPRVGCVLERGGALLGQGHTQAVGGDHAEVQALKAALAAGHSLAGATAFVTLEPCSHHGRTPPCVDALIRHGVARVVVALADPNPLVAGRGMQLLRDAGVVLELADPSSAFAQAAREINIGFLSRMQRGRPWVRLKAAASLDGITALNNGQSQWITGTAARDDGHHFRARACAVLTGVGTVLADDPLLSVRDVATPRQPRRVLIDSFLQAPLTAKLFQGAPVSVFCNSDQGAASDKARSLRALGHTVTAQTSHIDNAIELVAEKAYAAIPSTNKIDLNWVMNSLAADGINELHVEAGAKLNASLLRAGVVDELLIYLAPKLLGAGMGIAALGELASLADGLPLVFHSADRIGDDLRIIARTIHSHF
jgi:diaminohydroxyphosphoribosylaminopyrimidine deaminase / 5-amino-6-(5-phosphoribosylamino)uracil reductase